MVWFEAEAIERNWTPEPTGTRGAPHRYSEWAIHAL